MKNLFKLIILMLVFNTNFGFANNTVPIDITKGNNSMPIDIYKHIKDISINDTINYSVNNKSIPEINVNLRQSTNWYLFILPFITIIIVFFGYLYTSKLLKKQTELSKNEIKIEVLSKNRQAWINKLRDEISKFIGLSYSIIYQRRILNSLAKDNNYIFKEIATNLVKLEEVKYKIYLLINPNENNNNKMINILDLIGDKVSENQTINDEVSQLVNISQIILKNEWERVKKLK